jgi:hypothetical protein
MMSVVRVDRKWLAKCQNNAIVRFTITSRYRSDRLSRPYSATPRTNALRGVLETPADCSHHFSPR